LQHDPVNSNPLIRDVSELKGVGPKMADNLNNIGIARIQDLLFHLPLRYQDRTRLYPIGSLRHGQEVMIQGTVEHSEIVYRGRRMMLCKLSDNSGMIMLRFFALAMHSKKT